MADGDNRPGRDRWSVVIAAGISVLLLFFLASRSVSEDFDLESPRGRVRLPFNRRVRAQASGYQLRSDHYRFEH